VYKYVVRFWLFSFFIIIVIIIVIIIIINIRSDRFLDVALQYVGAVPYDECVRKAVQKQRAVYEAFPRSKCALAFKAIAQKVDTWPLPANPRGHLEFFVERLVHQTSAGPVQ